MAVRICIRYNGVPNSDVAPTQALGELSMLFGKGDGAASEDVADIANLLHVALLIV
jgi:hypothetical protein